MASLQPLNSLYPVPILIQAGLPDEHHFFSDPFEASLHIRAATLTQELFVKSRPIRRHCA